MNIAFRLTNISDIHGRICDTRLADATKHFHCTVHIVPTTKSTPYPFPPPNILHINASMHT